MLWMTSQSNKAPALCYIEPCALFQSHQWINLELQSRNAQLGIEAPGDTFITLTIQLRVWVFDAQVIYEILNWRKSTYSPTRYRCNLTINTCWYIVTSPMSPPLAIVPLQWPIVSMGFDERMHWGRRIKEVVIIWAVNCLAGDVIILHIVVE